jgi:tetratricopeptide (TPR) repeat protein
MQTEAASAAPKAVLLADLLRAAYRHLDAAGQIEPAKTLLGLGLLTWPGNGSLRLLAARIAEAEGRASDAVANYREAADALRAETKRQPKQPRLVLALAQALGKCGDAAAAAAALALARERGVDPTTALRAERGLAWSRKDWPSLRRLSEELIELQSNPGAGDFVALAIACRNLDEPAGAAAAAARALERDPRNVPAGSAAAWAALELGDAEAAISQYRELAGLAPDNPFWPFQIVRTLVLIGSVEEAARELGAALQRWPSAPALRALAMTYGFCSPDELAPAAADPLDIAGSRERELRQIMQRAPEDSALSRPVVAEDKARDVLVAEAPGAKTVVLVFTALNDVMSMPLPLFDRYLAALGVTAIYLKDFRRLRYLGGIASLGTDYPTTVPALRQLCGRLQAKRLCAIGYSAGGYAAIRYGVELAAARIVSFAGDTHMVRDPAARWERGYRLIRERVRAKFDDAEIDLRQVLTARRSSATIELVYPAAWPRDRAQAMHLSGIAGVALHPVTGCDDHNLLSWLALHADLPAMFGRLLGVARSS